MLSEEDQQLFLIAREAQINRNGAMHMLDAPNARELIVGVFVRVLLELPSHQEDYMVARVHDITEGEPYAGFSTDPAQTSATYLVLWLPSQLASINGVQYQLNSVSNSTMRESEFSRWLEDTRAENPAMVPTQTELVDVATRVRRVMSSLNAARPARRNNSADTQRRFMQQQQQQQLHQSAQTRPPLGHGAGGPPPLSTPTNGGARGSAGMSQSLESVFTALPRPDTARNIHFHPAGASQSLYSTSNGTIPTPNGTAGPTAAAAVGGGVGVRGVASARVSHISQDALLPMPVRVSPSSSVAINGSGNGGGAAGAAHIQSSNEDMELTGRLRKDVVNSLSQEGVLFPKDPTDYKLSRLRLVERDMLEYLEHVRDEIAAKRENCVVCLDHVPTVIFLPCTHKVLCRLCAPSFGTCPVCREGVNEMFEPEEV